MVDRPDDPIELAAVFALDALDDVERRRLERTLETADPEALERFRREVADTRAAMARIAEAGPVQPSDRLRRSILDAIDTDSSTSTDTNTDSNTDRAAEAGPEPSGLGQGFGRRWMWPALAAAAAVVIALGGIAVGTRLAPSADTVSEQVFAAPDVRTVSAVIGTDGTATVVFSRDTDAGVLVMNNVPPPAAGTVYQMWLLGPSGPVSAGTMTPDDVAPSTTAVLDDLGTSTALGFSVEPPGGSDRPGEIFAELRLT